jgi:hypothetical protein
VKFESKADLLGKLSYLVDINKAEATVASDKTRILNDIENGIGIEYLNSIVRAVLDGATGIASFGDLGSTVQCAACGDTRAIDVVMSNPSKSIFAVAAGGYANLLAMIIKKGADINVKINDGITVLMYTAYLGHNRCMELLISKRADVNVKDFRGKSALMYASQGGHIKCMEMLISKGADIDAKNKSMKTALIYAAEDGHTAALELLKRHGAVDSSNSLKGLQKSRSIKLFSSADDSNKNNGSVKLFSPANKKLSLALIDESPVTWKNKLKSCNNLDRDETDNPPLTIRASISKDDMPIPFPLLSP